MVNVILIINTLLLGFIAYRLQYPKREKFSSIQIKEVIANTRKKV